MSRILIGADRVQTLALMAAQMASDHSGYVTQQDAMDYARLAAQLLEAVEALVSEKPSHQTGA